MSTSEKHLHPYMPNNLGKYYYICCFHLFLKTGKPIHNVRSMIFQNFCKTLFLNCCASKKILQVK